VCLEGADRCGRRRSVHAIERHGCGALLAEQPLDRHDGIASRPGPEWHDEPRPGRGIGDPGLRQTSQRLERSDRGDGRRTEDTVERDRHAVAARDDDHSVARVGWPRLCVAEELLERQDVRAAVADALRRVERRDGGKCRPRQTAECHGTSEGEREPVSGERMRHRVVRVHRPVCRQLKGGTINGDLAPTLRKLGVPW
jgi:hypothetical protein